MPSYILIFTVPGCRVIVSQADVDPSDFSYVENQSRVPRHLRNVRSYICGHRLSEEKERKLGEALTSNPGDQIKARSIVS